MPVSPLFMKIVSQTISLSRDIQDDVLKGMAEAELQVDLILNSGRSDEQIMTRFRELILFHKIIHETGSQHQEYTPLAYRSQGQYIILEFLLTRTITNPKTANTFIQHKIKEYRSYKDGVNAAAAVIVNSVSSGDREDYDAKQVAEQNIKDAIHEFENDDTPDINWDYVHGFKSGSKIILSKL